MGESMKVVCEKCESSFKYETVKGMECCPVCGTAFDFEETENNKPFSFGDDIELGENDSFDEDKIDFWWYSIREPGTLDERDTGGVGITCTSCGHLSGTSYPIAKTDTFLLLDPGGYAKCSNCKKELKNHILSKRPSSWVDPRKRDMWVTDWKNQPKCPVCASTNIHKIGLTNKAASVVAFGVLAAGHVSKTYKCNTCGAKF